VVTDNNVEEVYRRRTSITSHKIRRKFGVPDTPALIFAVSRHSRHPKWLHHCLWYQNQRFHCFTSSVNWFT